MKSTSVAAWILDVPPLPCVLEGRAVFDAWSWCSSDRLDVRSTSSGGWQMPHLDGENPPGLVFVMRGEQHGTPSPLPTELARLHATGYGLEDELALAPWAIDDATDLLYEHRLRPRDVFWLAAGSLDALVWGLHDWVHFHNHGPFDQPAMTELQCDLVALAWLRRNAATLGVGQNHLQKVASDLARLSARRFVDEGVNPPVTDFVALFDGPYPGLLTP